jgi:DNA repair protein RadC
MSIIHWPEDDRPREKLLRRGAACLSDSELLAIFLRTGVRGLSAVDLARKLLDKFQSPFRLFYASQQEFTEIKGLGIAKYAQLMAVRELAKRALYDEIKQGSLLDSSESMEHFLRLAVARPDKELFYAVFLSSEYQLITHKRIAEGSLREVKVYPRELIKLTLDYNAAAVIIAHNHPGDSPRASHEDIKLTQHLKKALEYIDVSLLDHMIITSCEVYSMAKNGLI